MAAALPNWLVNAMADYPPMHNVSFQYHAETMAFLAAASAAGAGAIARRWPSRRRLLGIAVGLCALAQVGRPEPARLWQTPVTERHRAMARLLAAVPPEDAVSADSASATHLAHRFVLFHFPEGLDRADGDPARPPLCARVLSLAETDPRAEFSSFALLALNLQTGELFRRSLRACSQG